MGTRLSTIVIPVRRGQFISEISDTNGIGENIARAFADGSRDDDKANASPLSSHSRISPHAFTIRPVTSSTSVAKLTLSLLIDILQSDGNSDDDVNTNATGARSATTTPLVITPVAQSLNSTCLPIKSSPCNATPPCCCFVVVAVVDCFAAPSSDDNTRGATAAADPVVALLIMSSSSRRIAARPNSFSEEKDSSSAEVNVSLSFVSAISCGDGGGGEEDDEDEETSLFESMAGTAADEERLVVIMPKRRCDEGSMTLTCRCLRRLDERWCDCSGEGRL
mmetsp:Transcript_27423/g.33228  ORF Transcript_27423/g.33228 Transcript_27423/m.33228 type:complete len:279 (+) Transcript_27423:761-1597(+)